MPFSTLFTALPCARQFSEATFLYIVSMQKSNVTYLAGLIGPDVLTAIENDSLNPVFMDLQACSAIEIRYDFFEPSEWQNLSERVRKIAPHALQIGTIRLQQDGGKFSDNKAIERLALWKNILDANEVPEWLDIERNFLAQFAELKKMAAPRGVKLLVSEHNFVRIPNEMELKDYLNDLKRIKADGLKIAAMSNSESDCDRLYKFTKKNRKNFELFAAFGMGKTGKTSRLWSIKEGANLTYGAINSVEAPGQIDVITMRKALNNFEILYSQNDLMAFLSKFGQF